MLQRLATKCSKPKNTRGRIALPGGDLQSLALVGGSELSLVAEFGSLQQEMGQEVKAQTPLTLSGEARCSKSHTVSATQISEITASVTICWVDNISSIIVP